MTTCIESYSESDFSPVLDGAISFLFFDSPC
ncbi:MAG: hypothetical protein ACI9GK_002868, partial [Devosia sp.]